MEMVTGDDAEHMSHPDFEVDTAVSLALQPFQGLLLISEIQVARVRRAKPTLGAAAGVSTLEFRS